MATQGEATARTGLALLAVHRAREGDFIGYCGLIVGRASAAEPEIAYELHRVRDRVVDDGGELIWLTRRLP